MANPIYLPGLNGLRAISAIVVVLAHIAVYNGTLKPYMINGQPLFFSFAGYGVTIFFVLSGFLITYLLQQEKEIQKIDVKKFYLRRILRIWPLYYLYLVIALIVIALYKIPFDHSYLLYYIFFAANIPCITLIPMPLIGHYWSLGVEEQFYLFWPWVNKKISHIIIFLSSGILLLITLKIILHIYFNKSILDRILRVTEFDCMMIGALAAILYRMKNKLFLKFTDNILSQIIAFGVLFLLAINRYHVASIIDNEFISIMAVVLIIGQINIKNRLINLDGRIFNFLGKISYSIYIIHPLVIFLFVKFLDFNMADSYKTIYAYISCLSISIVLAWLSYTFYESYFLKLKKKVTVIESTNSR